MASITRAVDIQLCEEKAPWPSNARWPKRALGAARIRGKTSARRDIVTRRAEVIAELHIIPSKIALAEVQATSVELPVALDQVDGVMTRARDTSRAADPLLRSTEELMSDASRPPVKPSEFDAWLHSPTGG